MRVTRRRLAVGVLLALASAALIVATRDPYRWWLADQSRTGRDPATYSIVELAPGSPPPSMSVLEGVVRADLIVEGTVERLTFGPSGRSIALINVLSGVKGMVPMVVAVASPSTLRPAGEAGAPVIVERPDQPILLPGRHVVLLLEHPDFGGQIPTYEVLPWVGTYLIVDGVVTTAPGNPWAATFQGMPRDEFLARLLPDDSYPH